MLQAPNQNYQRSFPLSYNSGDSTKPDYTDTAFNNYVGPTEEIFIIAGTGGHALDTTAAITPQAYTAKIDTIDYGYLWLVSSLQNTVLTGTFYDVKNVSKDSFSITRTDVEN